MTALLGLIAACGLVANVILVVALYRMGVQVRAVARLCQRTARVVAAQTGQTLPGLTLDGLDLDEALVPEDTVSALNLPTPWGVPERRPAMQDELRRARGEHPDGTRMNLGTRGDK